MTIVDLLILAGACWLVSFTLTSTQGPMGVFARLRELGGGRWHGRVRTYKTLNNIEGPSSNKSAEVIDKDYHGLLDCIICLSFWVAQLLSFVTGHTFIEGLAIAGVALWLHRYTGWAYQQ